MRSTVLVAVWIHAALCSGGGLVELDEEFQTPMCSLGDEKPVGGKPVARVVVALYGLFRHDCGSYNFDSVFRHALQDSEKYTYIVDVILHANTAVHEDKVPDQKYFHKTPKGIHVPSLEFLRWNPCNFDVTGQELVDARIEPILEKTCRIYGDHWDKGSKECATTKNYFRALFSQRNAAELIRAHETKANIQYDVVVVVRPDVMMTRTIDVKYFDDIVEQSRASPPTEVLYMPSWATFNGYNDRFMMGHAGPTLAAMMRLDGVVDYVGQMTDIMSQRIHSESYMKWRVDAYVALRHEAGYVVDLRIVDAFYFRRVRSDGFLVFCQYKSSEAHTDCCNLKKRGSCPLQIDSREMCDQHKLACEFDYIRSHSDMKPETAAKAAEQACPETPAESLAIGNPNLKAPPAAQSDAAVGEPSSMDGGRQSDYGRSNVQVWVDRVAGGRSGGKLLGPLATLVVLIVFVGYVLRYHPDQLGLSTT